jgi:hypothetical protein
MDEERPCKTCCHFNEEAYYCRAYDTAMDERDSCKDHETYQEILARVKRENKLREARHARR